jgi:hypothetical protein
MREGTTGATPTFGFSWRFVEIVQLANSQTSLIAEKLIKGVAQVAGNYSGKSTSRANDISQQIRGSCSPNSTSTTRVPPIPVFINTIPG